MTEEVLFDAALDIDAEADRRAFLDDACRGDGRLRRRIESLLAAVDRCDGILDRGPADDPRADTVFAGRFKLRQKLGEGGMGEVWVADQSEPVQRRVAIKMIRSGLDSTRLLARFDQERQALAAMDHPNIAKVLDAGVAAGRPYFVMELIKGVPITTYCDDAKLTPRERLALFIPVCQAVQHAHQKGIIHRDLKPSNILVALYDGVPVPKVIDFGVAKATGPRIAPGSVCTEVGSLVGTVEYMSPEQAELNNLDVDTRSDIYALGVVLYEVLTGTVPFTRQTLQAATFVEMLRIIKEDAPPKPSTRLSAETRPDVAAVRRTPPAKLASTVRGDLDWIVMKCLEKERARRYETANGLAADLARHLASEPVLAGPPAAGYRLRKFVARNRGPVLAGSLILLALVGGIVGTTAGMVQARQRAEGERLAKEESRLRLARVEQGIDLLLLVFTDLNPRSEEKEGKPLRAILGDRLLTAAAALDADDDGDPLHAARLRDRIGQALLNLGVAGQAVPLFEKSRAVREAHLGPDHPDTLSSANNLARGLQDDGKLMEAMAIHEDTLRRRRVVLGDADPDTLKSMNNLAGAHRAVGDGQRALDMLEEVLRRRRGVLGPFHQDTLTALSNVAIALSSVKRLDEAFDRHSEAFALRSEHLGPDHVDTLKSMAGVAAMHSQLGRLDRAMPMQEEVVRRTRAKLGPRHTETAFEMNNLAITYMNLKMPAKGVPLFEETLQLRRDILPADHPETLVTLYFFGVGLEANGQLERALALYLEAAAGVEKVRFKHRAAAVIVQRLCAALEKAGRTAEAEVWRRK